MSSFELSGKYAVVTGGGSGLTLDYVKLLLSKGCSVIVGDLALRLEAEVLLTEYPHPPKQAGKGSTPSFLFQQTDVLSWAQLSGLWARALEVFPRVDLVVPGAGVFEPDSSSFWIPPGVEGSLSQDDPATDMGLYATFGVNLMHPIRLAQLALGYWTTNKIKGTALFIGSIAGYTATIGTPYYYSSKHGLHGFVKSLAAMRSRLGIRVICVAPGVTRTPLWESPHCRDKVKSKDAALDSQYVAEVMMDITEDEKYGDGNIVEVIDLGTAEVPRPSIRELPVHLLYPHFSSDVVPSMMVEEEKLWQKLEATGFKA